MRTVDDPDLAAKRRIGPRLFRGYGRISWNALLHSYGATFSPGQPDSVVGAANAGNRSTSSWWRILADWPGPTPGEPRTLAGLVARFPAAFFLVAVSEPYLRAITPDLTEAAKHLAHADRLAVICAGASPHHPLAEFLVPCDGRHRALVNGARASLNVRLARKLVQELPVGNWSLPRARSQFVAWFKGAPEQRQALRTPQSDTEVLRFIREALRETPDVRPSPLLRRCRDQGRACEQQRFLRLFREFQETCDVRPD